METSRFRKMLVSFIGMTFLVFGIPLIVSAATPDEIIVERVRGAFFEDPRVRSADITVKSIDGIVELDGTVRTLAELQFADLEAKKIRGVLGVINKLTVKPVYRLDAEIRQDIKRRIISSSIIRSENIGVRVENGIVFLSGVVGTSAEQEQVYLLASEVRGVKSIENHIEISFATKRSDPDIREDVLLKFAHDVYLSELPIDVSVKNGLVSLSGEVGNTFEKERAQQDALRIFNVAGVKNDLKISKSKAGGVRRNPPELSDPELLVAIGNQFGLDSRFDNPKDIHVQVLHGIVTLTGTVPSFFQKQLAERDALEIVGVQWVNNLIQVKGIWRDDIGIFMDIKESISSDYPLIGDRISYYVIDGIVTLKGNVNSEYEKTRIERDAGEIIGVKDVLDYIVVDRLPQYSDEVLSGRIYDRLTSNWVTWPILQKIIINVKDGKVTLTGKVDTWAQHNEAGRIAKQTDGVWSVENRLSVQ